MTRVLDSGHVLFSDQSSAKSGRRNSSNVSLSQLATVASCDKATFDEFLRPLFADDS